MRKNKRLIQAAKALRTTGFHFDQVQFAGIHRNAGGRFSGRQRRVDLAGNDSVVCFSPGKTSGKTVFVCVASPTSEMLVEETVAGVGGTMTIGSASPCILT